ncbi:MAG: hypothetical protein HQL94_07595 [Magnetococcales bacterium]|nr:hypothetical protein [Magnetococcales bacterium]
MENKNENNKSQYDTTFKDLFTYPPQFLLYALFGQKAIRHLSIEFASTMKRLPDLLFEMADDSISHIELQGRPEIMNWRMLMYYSFIRQTYPDKRLIQIVLYVGYEPWNQKDWIDEPSLHFSYSVIDIRTINCQVLMDSPVLEENILAVLCQMHDQQETIREILYRISLLPKNARADALTKLVIISRLRRLETIIKEEAQEMSLVFNVMENDVLRPLFQKAQMDGEQKGKAETLLQLLQERFGLIPESVQKTVTSANLDDLTAWISKIFKADSLQAVFH